jgi:Ca2+-binding RTX toxin-like protein
VRGLICVRAGLALTAVAALTLVAAPAQAALKCDGKPVTIRGTEHDDDINGTARADVIAALGGNDHVHGLGGNDRICGGRGKDQLLGDRGNDRLFGQLDFRSDSSHKHGDTLNGGIGNDLLVPGFDGRPISGANVPDVVSWRASPKPISLNMAEGTATGLGHDRIVGHAYTAHLSDRSDRVTGSRGNDFIETFAGSDNVRGGGGADFIFTDDPNRPTAASGPSSDLVYGGAGDDWVIGREGFDHLYGGTGEDNIEDRGTTADVINGGPGADIIGDTLAAGTREHLTGDRTDNLQVSNYSNQHTPGTLNLQAHTIHLDGVAGDGYINGFGSMEFDTLFGAGGVTFHGRPWTVIGTPGPDLVASLIIYPVRFISGGGNDRFVDGEGDDTFDAGPGTDEIAGNGGGTDTCTSVEVGLDQCEVVTP